MATLEERYEEGQSMRALMAGGDLSHFTLPGIDQLAPEQVVEVFIQQTFYVGVPAVEEGS